MPLDSDFLRYSAAKLTQLNERIGDCVDRLSSEQIWARGSENQNALGNLMLHLAGNVTQWILHGVAGEEDRRTRAWEFSNREPISAADLKSRLGDAVERACVAIVAVPAERLADRITIQGHDVTKLEAIYHVVEHFSYHTGQIAFVTKAATGSDLGFYAYLTGSARSGPQIP